MIQKKRVISASILVLLLGTTIIPLLAQASVESSLLGVQTKLTRVILPVLSVIGIALAGLSFLTGNENAKKHIIYAIIGTAIGFGAQSITDLISQTVR
ncbi:MAG: TrbC/VirB2 family protein [Pseudobdellovibrionaceae bacterium]